MYALTGLGLVPHHFTQLLMFLLCRNVFINYEAFNQYEITQTEENNTVDG
jgi:hypothetical protein